MKKLNIAQSRHKKLKGQPNGIRRAIIYLRNLRGLAFLPYFFMFVATFAQLAVPAMVRRVIDAITSGVTSKMLLESLDKIPPAFLEAALPKILSYLNLPGGWTADQLTVYLAAQVAKAPQALLMAGISIVVFAAVRGLFAFLQSYWAERNSQSMAFDLRNDLYSKIQRLSFSYHDRNQTGQLMVRATDDVEKVRLFLGQGLLQLVGAVMLLTGTLVILFTSNAQLAVYTLWILPAAMIMFMIFSGAARPLFTIIQQKLSKVNTILQENLAGVRVIKAFTREPAERKKFGSAVDDLLVTQLKVARLFSFLFPIVFLIANLGQATVLYYGGQQIILGTLTLGQYQEFSLYLIYLFMPIAQFGFIITQYSQASASATRVFEILDAKNDVVNKTDALDLPVVDGRVQFDHVSFRYFGGGEPVLNDVSFDIQPGQTVALLGATGSGKTSIINLLPRFYDPTEGNVLIDGHDLRDVCLDSLRRQIGIVLQETTLFSGSIRDNISFGKTDATLDEVMAAAKAAAAHEFIISFPQGYDTPVGERGTTLSGGQKQRIAIARALLLDPRILILDDSTSSVDLTTEAEIQTALDTLMKGRTSFVIAQRITTVMNADVILVMDKGKVVASGKHGQLMEESEIYTEIYNSQLIGEEKTEIRE
jgi:ATP-binding cassette subfamily B multidrug efflux pump